MSMPADHVNDSNSRSKVLLVAVMVSTMALGAFPIVGTAVVATFLARDLGMSLTLFGAGVAVNTLFGAISLPCQVRLVIVTAASGPAFLCLHPQELG